MLPRNIAQLPTALSMALYYHLYFSAPILMISLRYFRKERKKDYKELITHPASDAEWVISSLDALYMLMMLSCLYPVSEDSVYIKCLQ